VLLDIETLSISLFPYWKALERVARGALKLTRKTRTRGQTARTGFEDKEAADL